MAATFPRRLQDHTPAHKPLPGRKDQSRSLSTHVRGSGEGRLPLHSLRQPAYRQRDEGLSASSSLHINVVPSSPYLLRPEMHPILIPIETHRFFLGRHLGSRQKTALSTPKQFLPVSNMHHRGRGTSAWAWNSIGECAQSHGHHARHTS